MTSSPTTGSELPEAELRLAPDLPLRLHRLLALATRLLPVVVFGAVAIRYWRRFGEFVTGLDPGNWFAIGRGLWGESGKSTDSIYPPFVPFLLEIGRSVVDPMIAAKMVALGSLIAILVATYLVARQAMNLWFTLATVATVGLTGAIAELMVLGSYPQHYAFAFLLLAALALTHYLVEGHRRHLFGVAAATIGAALSHHMYFVLTVFVLGSIWVLWLTTKPERPAIVRRTLNVALAGGLAVLCFLPTLIAMYRGGYDAPINAGDLGAHAALTESIREAPKLWLFIFVAALAYIVATYRRRGEPTWQVAAGLMAPVLVLFPLTAEQRLIPAFVVGASLGFGLLLQDLWALSYRSAWGGLPLTAAIVPILVLLSPHAEATLDEVYANARTADQSLVNTAAFVDANQGDGFVIVRQDREQLPIGWWFEGLTEAKIAVGSYEGALAFPKERDQARLVNLFFDQPLTSAAVADLAGQRGVDFLVFRKWEWLGWLAWLDEPTPAITVVYDDGEFMVFDVNPQ